MIISSHPLISSIMQEENVLNKVKESCQEYANALKENQILAPVVVNQQKIQEYIDLLNDEKLREIKSLSSSLNFKQIKGKFFDAYSKAGFILFLHALDFGGGYRKELHKFHRKGAFQTIEKGVHNFREDAIRMQPNEDYPEIPMKFLAKLSLSRVEGLFELGNCGPDLAPFVEKLDMVVKELANVSIEQGRDRLGDHVAQILEKNPSAHKLVGELVKTYPKTFADEYDVEFAGKSFHVCFFKKAQLCVGEMYEALKDKKETFKFSDASNLTAYIDNVICAVCRKLGVIDVSPELTKKIETGVMIPKGSIDEVALRACSLVAVEEIVKGINQKYVTKVQATDIGNYFWGDLGKTPDFRLFERHATKDTVFY